MKRQFKYLFISALLLCNYSLTAQKEGWNTLKTGAGGWITGMDIHPSGSPILVRSDVGGAYRYRPATNDWIQLVTNNSIPAEDVMFDQYQGVLSIVSAPSNNTITYMAYNRSVYRSTDQGDTWIKSNISLPMSPNNDSSKLSGERLAVDPANANVVYFGSINDGLWHTTNGNTWSKVQGIPSGTNGAGIRQILFDKNSGTIDGKTKRIYLFIDGAGIYKSDNAGQSWQNISFASGVQFLDAEIAADGKVYTCGSFGLQQYNGSQWRNIRNPGVQRRTIGEIAVDPFDANRIITLSNGFSETARTLNANATTVNWVNITNRKVANNIPWLAWADVAWFSLGEAVFDPSVRNKVWVAHGVGTWYFVDDGSTTNHDWIETAAGQEHMVANDLIALPNDKTVTAFWDRKLFRHENVDTYPLIHQPNNQFGSAWDIDQSPEDPNHLVAIIEDHRGCCTSNDSGVSTDGGQTWTTFANLPPGSDKKKYGRIAISAGDKNNIVWMRGIGEKDGSAPDIYYTVNGGSSWIKTTIPGAGTGCCLDWKHFIRNSLVADRVNPHTFYIYDYTNGNIYSSTNKGATWTTHPQVLPAYSFHTTLVAVPGKADHLLFADGPDSLHSSISPAMHSTDGGKMWTALPNTSQVINIAVGKAAAQSAYPTIFIQGKVNGDFGYYMSTDQGNSWIPIGKYPTGIYDWAKVLQGDMNVFGRVFVGFPGNSFVYYNHEGGVDPPPPTPAEDMICKASTPLSIDGDLDAVWESIDPKILQNNTGVVTNDTDLSGNYRTAWDNDYLYVYVSVQDDILNNDSVNPWEDDSVEIYIDGGNEKNSTYDQNDHQLVFGYNDPVAYHPSTGIQDPAGVQFSQQETGIGYDVEVRIAWSFIGASVAADQKIGIDVHFNDDDDGAGRDGKLMWSDLADIAYTDTSVFGTMQLDNENCTITTPPPTAEDVMCKTSFPPSIDGYKDLIWESGMSQTLQNKADTVTGENDLFGTYNIAWDNDYLYVYASVQDDILNNDSVKPWDDDSVEIYIDGGNEKGSSYDQNDHQLVFRYNDPVVYHPSTGIQDPAGVQFSQQETSIGYDVEVRIAWSFIGVTATADQQIGIDIHVNDDDNGAGRDGKLMWSDTQDIAYMNPSVFTSLSLSAASCLNSSSNMGTLSDDEITIFPVPAKDKLHISLNPDISIRQIRLVHVSGNVALHENGISNTHGLITIDTRLLTHEGMYFLELYTRSGKITKKILITK